MLDDLHLLRGLYVGLRWMWRLYRHRSRMKIIELEKIHPDHRRYLKAWNSDVYILYSMLFKPWNTSSTSEY